MNQTLGLSDVFSFFETQFARGPHPRAYALVMTVVLGPVFLGMFAYEKRFGPVGARSSS